MKSLIKSWLLFNINHAKSMMVVLSAITLFFSLGILKLKFETSIDYLMPRHEEVYKLGERANLAFLDSETFIITSVEPSEGNNLFSREVFSGMEKMIEEIEQYKDFDLEKENQRIDALLNISGVKVKVPDEKESKKSKSTGKEKEVDRADTTEAEFDKMFLEQSQGGAARNTARSDNKNSDTDSGQTPNQTSTDLWDLTKPVPEKVPDQPARPRQSYDYSKYNPVSIDRLRAALDKDALSQLDTVLLVKDIDVKSGQPLAKNDFKKIMEAWEDIYFFKSIEIIQIFINPFSGKDISGKNNKLSAVEFIEKNKNGIRELPQSPAQYEEFRRKIRANPMYKNFLYSENEKGEIQAFALSVILKNRDHHSAFSEYYIPLLTKYNKGPLAVNSMGTIVLEKYMSDYMKNDLLKFMPFVFIIIILTFYFNFRDFSGVLLSTLTVIFAGIWTMGLMGYLGVKISLAVSILPPLLIAIGSYYAIYLYNQYMVEHVPLRTKGSAEKLAESMVHISGTVILAVMATVISFLTLAVSQVTSLRDFGIFAAVGSFFAMNIAVVIIPAGLMIMRPRPHRVQSNTRHNPLVHKIVSGFSYLALSHTKKVVFLFIVMIILGFIGVLEIKTETAPLESFKKGSPVRIADNRLNKLFSGTINLTLIIDSGKKNGALDPEFLRWVEDLRAWLNLPENREKNSVLSNSSFSDIIKRVNMAIHSDDPQYYTLPEKADTIRQYIELLSAEDRNSDGRPDQIEQFVDREYRRINLIIRTGSYKDRTLSSANDRNIIRVVNAHLKDVPNPVNYKYFFVGTGINMLILSDYIVSGQLSSIISSILLIMLIIYFFFKKKAISIISMIPLAGAIFMIYGIMGLLGIPLDIPRAILASIAIGNGVDETIHFLRSVGAYVNRGKSFRQAIELTYNEAGTAIIYTSMAVILGFAVLTLSSFTPIFSLGLLIVGVMVATSIGALLFLPAFLLIINPDMQEINSDTDQ